MPLVREPGSDETDEVAHQLCDWVDLHNVNKLSSRSAVGDEEVPDIRRMRADGWVFGEPNNGLEMVATNKEEGAHFTIIPCSPLSCPGLYSRYFVYSVVLSLIAYQHADKLSQ
jgi:hypothetical protein